MMSSNTPAKRGFRWFILIVILLVATFFRLHRLDQVPPGLNHDEAYNGLDAQHLVQSGDIAVFYPDNAGREPLHIYLLALAISLLGERVWVLRVVSAFSAILAIPLMYRLGCDLRQRDRSEWNGYLAAIALAVSYWHINFSRISFRAILLVTLSSAAVWLFWRGRQTSSYRLMVLSGLALGASLYTYVAARFLLLVFLAFTIFQILSLYQGGRASFGAVVCHPLTLGGLVVLGTAMLVFLPLGMYFLNHPTHFLLRSANLSVLKFSGPTLQDSLSVLGQNLLAVIRMFIDRGDPQPLLNLPARPAFDILQLIGLWLGLLIASFRWRQPRNTFVLLWFWIMLLPTILSIEAPHFLRAIGVLPPSCILVSDGLTSLGALWTRAKPRLASVGWLVLLLSVLSIAGFLTYRDYFLRWAQSPALADPFEMGRYTIAQRALALNETYDVVLPLETYVHPTVQFVLEPTVRGLVPIDTWPKDRPIVVIAPGDAPFHSSVVLHRTATGETIAFVTHPLGEQFTQQLHQYTSSQILLEHFGWPVADEISGIDSSMLDKGVSVEPVNVTFSDSIRLVGYTRQPMIAKPGDVIHLTLWWESLEWIHDDYVVFVHVVSSTGNGIAQTDRSPVDGVYATSLWHPGDTVPDTYDFTIPTTATPGKYHFEVGLYPAGDVDPLPASGPDGPVGDRATLGVFTISPSLQTMPPLANSLGIVAGDPPTMKLLGYDLIPTTLKPGESLNVVLDWQALRAIAQDYTVFVHMLDEQGQIRAQQDGPPAEGRFPTSSWFPGERIRDEHQILLGRDVAPGVYRLTVGLYHWPSGGRLPLFDGAGLELPDSRLLLPIPIRVEDAAP